MADIKKWARDRKKNVESLGRDVKGVYHQVNTFDGGRTYDTNQRGVNVGVKNPVNMKSDNTPGFQLGNNSFTRGASRLIDQVNPADNGRTWKDRMPTGGVDESGNIWGNRNAASSGIHQLTHGAVPNVVGSMWKPVQNTGEFAISEPARTLIGSITGNKQAEAAANTRRDIALDESLPGMALNTVWETGDAAVVNPFKSVVGDLTGNVEASRNANRNSVSSFNETPFGRLLSPLQHSLSEDQVRRDQPGLSPEQQAELIRQNKIEAGLNPDATGAQQGIESSLAALQLYGTVKAPEIYNNPASIITDPIDMIKGTKNVVKNTSTVARAKIQPLGASSAVVKSDELYKTLNTRAGAAIDNAANSTGKLKENYRVEAVELIRQRNARVRELSQGGYINPGGMADDAKKVVKKVTGKSDEVKPGLKAAKEEISKEAEARTLMEFASSPYSKPNEVKKVLARMKELSGNEDGFAKIPGKANNQQQIDDLLKKRADSMSKGTSEYTYAYEQDLKKLGYDVNNPPVSTVKEAVPSTRAYGKTIEMTPENGYKAIKTPSGNIYSKVQTEGSNIKGTRGPIERWYTPDGTKLTRAQAEAYQSGALKIQAPKDTRKLIPAAKNKSSTRAVPTKKDPNVKNTRFATKTVQESREVSEGTKKAVREADNSYKMVHNDEQLARSEKFIKKNNIRNATADVKERLMSKDLDNQTVADSIAVAKKLDAKGGKANLIASSEIYETLSKKLTEAGQFVQSARLLNNRTPEGMKYWATTQLKKANGKDFSLPPEKAAKLEKLINDIRKAKPDSYDQGLSRYRVAEFVAKNSPNSNTAKAIQIWKAGLLSSPRTTMGNLFANTAETIFKKGFVDPVANATDALMSVVTGKRSRSYTVRGMPSGTAEGIGKGIKYFKTGYDPRNPDVKWDIRNIHYSDKPLGKAAEAYTQTIFRLMGSQDQPFYYANMRNSLYDQAITAAKNSKLKGAERQAFIKKFVTEPSKDALELADAEGRYAVFQNPTALGKAASRLKGMDGAAGNVAEFIMPFSGVPSSIATRMIERTPIGFAAELVKQIRKGKFDQRAMSKAIANGTAVVPLIGAGYALAQSGQISLGYPTDKNERELWEAEGRQPYSIKVGDEWLSMNYFQPGGAIISAGAEYKNALDEGKTATEALTIATAASGKAFTEQSFLKGVSGGLNALTDPVYAGEKFVDQTAGSIVPNFIRASATASDSVKREAPTVLDQVRRGIPGLRQTLDVKKDLFGRDVQENTSGPNALLNPLRPSRVQNADDPTTSEIRRLTDADQGVTPTQIKKDAFYDKDTQKGTKLTDKQVKDFNAEVGTAVKVEWDKIMANPKYSSMNDEEKSKLLRKVNDDTYGALKRKYEADNKLGEYAPDYEGEENKLSTNEKRYLEGKEIDYYAKDSSERNPTEEYEYQKEKFDEEKDSYNEIERTQKETEIRKLGIKKDYDEITTDLYDLNKGDAYDYIASKGEAGEAAFMRAVEYGDKLVEAGIEEKNKWRDKYGNIDLESGSKSASGGKGKKPWQAPATQAIKQSSGADNRALIASAIEIKARRTRRKFA